MLPEDVKRELIKRYPLTFRDPVGMEAIHMNGMSRRTVLSIAQSGDMIWKLLCLGSDADSKCYLAMREYNGKDWVELGFPSQSADHCRKLIGEDWDREMDRLTAYMVDFVGSSGTQHS